MSFKVGDRVVFREDHPYYPRAVTNNISYDYFTVIEIQEPDEVRILPRKTNDSINDNETYKVLLDELVLKSKVRLLSIKRA